ncbi:hypothetical protein C8F01DRAFT_1305007 [Mycena amicta]|nr:hypothetical protein C8F01DRAFT_1305007 [Mycena amicta]
MKGRAAVSRYMSFPAAPLWESRRPAPLWVLNGLLERVSSDGEAAGGSHREGVVARLGLKTRVSDDGKGQRDDEPFGKILAQGVEGTDFSIPVCRVQRLLDSSLLPQRTGTTRSSLTAGQSSHRQRLLDARWPCGTGGLVEMVVVGELTAKKLMRRH